MRICRWGVAAATHREEQEGPTGRSYLHAIWSSLVMDKVVGVRSFGSAVKKRSTSERAGCACGGFAKRRDGRAKGGWVKRSRKSRPEHTEKRDSERLGGSRGEDVCASVCQQSSAQGSRRWPGCGWAVAWVDTSYTAAGGPYGLSVISIGPLRVLPPTCTHPAPRRECSCRYPRRPPGRR